MDDKKNKIKNLLGISTKSNNIIASKRSLIIISSVSISIFLIVVLFISYLSSPEFQYDKADIIRDNMIVNIMATGNIKPLNQVEVGAEVSGLIQDVYVDFNDIVKKGTMLAILDTDQLEARVRQSRAQLSSSRAKVKEAEANKIEASNNLQRAMKLYNQGNFSEKSLDNAQASFSRSEAAHEIALSQVTISEANLFSDETNLSKAAITAPIDGIILERKVEPGQTVASSFQTPILFSIAEDLTVMELTVDIDEADIGQINVGQKAIFLVDAYPGKVFPSTLKAVRFSPKDENGVITYEALLEVANSDLLLRPGMTARATITTAEKNNVFMVPYSALRFMPPPEFMGEEKKSNIQSQRRAPGFIGMLMPKFSRSTISRQAPIKSGAMLDMWILKDNTPHKINVQVGLLDGQLAEVSSAELNNNTEVILGMRIKE